jgi:hypothetical protein
MGLFFAAKLVAAAQKPWRESMHDLKASESSLSFAILSAFKQFF